MFVDASALVAIVGREDGWEDLAIRMNRAKVKFVSPLSIWEATRGLHRSGDLPLEQAESLVRNVIQVSDASIIAIDDEIGREALLASRLYGRGRHKAALNFGDCFAYACAKVLSVPLLAKGNDFPRTDIELA